MAEKNTKRVRKVNTAPMPMSMSSKPANTKSDKLLPHLTPSPLTPLSLCKFDCPANNEGQLESENQRRKWEKPETGSNAHYSPKNCMFPGSLRGFASERSIT